jgi:serine/threonine protein kinase
MGMVALEEALWEDDERFVYRTARVGADGDRQPVLAVLPTAENATPDNLNRLRHEYGLRDDLDDAWAARPLELVRERGQTMLLLKDPGGEPLNRLIGPPTEVGRFLRLAIALAVAVGRLHARGLNHKDIKPTNILVNSATGQAWLTGFGIAGHVPRALWGGWIYHGDLSGIRPPGGQKRPPESSPKGRCATASRSTSIHPATRRH